MEENELKQIPLTAFFAALAIALPQFFHLLGLGAVFLPMFLPVAAGAMLLSWKFALTLALIVPITSWLITGMPPLVPPILPVIVAELAIIALSASYLRYHRGMNVWIALFTAILLDRIFLFILVSFLAPLFGWNHPLFSVGIVASGLPGIALQIIVIPLVMRFIKEKYPQYYNLNKS